MLYEGVSARPTTISLAEIRESVSGQPMSAAGQTQKSGSATGKPAPQERPFLRTAASRQKRSFVVFGLETDLLARCDRKIDLGTQNRRRARHLAWTTGCSSLTSTRMFSL